MVDREDGFHAQHAGACRCHQAHRPGAVNCQAVARPDAGVHHGLAARGQDIAQEQHLLVIQRVGNADRADVCLRYAHIFGLPARHAAVQVGIAEHGGA